jgi:hypothetical protein
LSGIYLLERILGIGLWVVVIGVMVLGVVAAIKEESKKSSVVREISPTPLAQPKSEETPIAEPREHGVYGEPKASVSLFGPENQWAKHLAKRLERAWTPPPRPVGLGDLKAMVTVEFWGTGAVKKMTLRRSGSAPFDQSVEESVRRSLPVPRLSWLASNETATMELWFSEKDTPVKWPEG